MQFDTLILKSNQKIVRNSAIMGRRLFNSSASSRFLKATFYLYPFNKRGRLKIKVRNQAQVI